MAADATVNGSRRWRRAIPLLLFLLGLAGGLALSRWEPQGRRDGSRDRLMDRLTSELGLSAEQISRVNVVIEANHSEASAFREESMNRYREMRRRYREQIRAILDPEQLERFESMTEDADRRRGGHGGRR